MGNSEIMLASGKYFRLLSTGQEIKIEDIAHALSHLCRFTGHTREFYSVAQHSVLCSHLVPAEFALEALLHDATEAYIGDMSTPLKSLLPRYKAIESAIWYEIADTFGVARQLSQEVKRADLIMLATERRDLLNEHNAVWPELAGIKPAWFHIIPHHSSTARCMFMTRFKSIMAGRALQVAGIAV